MSALLARVLQRMIQGSNPAVWYFVRLHHVKFSAVSSGKMKIASRDAGSLCVAVVLFCGR